MGLPPNLNTIKSNYERVMECIHAAALHAGRDPESVRLVVVTKGQKVERLRQAVGAGANRLGENYVEEALDKMVQLEQHVEVEWHMIGHIQSRKARQVAENFDFVHSLDSTKLAVRLDRFSEESHRQLPVLLECNVSGEGSKFGFPAWEAEHWHALAAAAYQITDMPNLSVQGLMTMPPYFDDPEDARPYFQRLVRLRDFLCQQLPQLSWSELSMGMSGDYEIAVQEGATLLRVGEAIMGLRPE